MIDDILNSLVEASYCLPLAGEERISAALNAVADAIGRESDRLLEANAADLALMERENPTFRCS